MTTAMKYSIAGFIAFGLVVGAFFVFSYKQSVTPVSCSDAHVKIAAFGDSLVAGYGATQEHDLPTLLSQTLGVPVQNFGVSGNTTADALARISKVLDAKPDVVVVLLGGNDALQRVPLNTTLQNLSKIIDTFQKAHIKVVLVGVLGGFPSDPYKPMFESIATQYKVQLVPNILSGLFGNTNLMSDDVHPNDAGYVKVAMKIAPSVETTCAEK